MGHFDDIAFNPPPPRPWIAAKLEAREKKRAFDALVRERAAALFAQALETDGQAGRDLATQAEKLLKLYGVKP